MSTGHDRTLVLGPDAREERVRKILPDFDAIAVATAIEHGVCLRPMLLEQHDTISGTKEFVPVPCGNTQESVCVPCARKAQRLRMMQAREGWHLDHEPRIEHTRPSLDQQQLMLYRADVCALLDTSTDPIQREDLAAEIVWIDKQLTALGMRGRTPGLPDDGSADDSAEVAEQPAPHRSTRRDDDAPDLPRNPIDKSRTIGREYAGRFRPSMFITLTLDSYGRVHREDGTPLDPDRYDYQRAAWDAITFAALVDRWIQNLRRVIGWEIQYFATIEPQRRGAPHIHLALRGSVPRHIIRQVTAATYRNIWWPPIDNPRYSADTVLPVWDREQRTFVDPHTRQPLADWNDAVADLEQPVHKVTFGVQVHYKGILGGTREADRHIGYLCKYLTKSVTETLAARSPRQHTHFDRLHAHLAHTPCSPRCPLWLLHGIVPKNAGARIRPGSCKARAHRRSSLGLPGRRVLSSTRWTGKTLGDLKADRLEFVRRTLAAVGIDKPAPEPGRYTWSTVAPGARVPSRATLLMRAIAQRQTWRAEYERALAAAPLPNPAGERDGPDADLSAIGRQQTCGDNIDLDQAGRPDVC